MNHPIQQEPHRINKKKTLDPLTFKNASGTLLTADLPIPVPARDVPTRVGRCAWTSFLNAECPDPSWWSQQPWQPW
jgi:hypothetical protein